MIDEEKLNRLEQTLYLTEDPVACKELIELARLGIWARDTGIPALKKYSDESRWNDHLFVLGKSYSTRKMADVGFINSNEPPFKIAKEALKQIEKE